MHHFKLIHPKYHVCVCVPSWPIDGATITQLLEQLERAIS